MVWLLPLKSANPRNAIESPDSHTDGQRPRPRRPLPWPPKAAKTSNQRPNQRLTRSTPHPLATYYLRKIKKGCAWFNIHGLCICSQPYFARCWANGHDGLTRVRCCEVCECGVCPSASSSRGMVRRFVAACGACSPSQSRCISMCSGEVFPVGHLCAWVG
ncbi:uncharacterized protein BKA78DRAFT_38464 [Phyllosticta capitalensis]|uniref:uncharacterized protein n=1 Tax=Phyllosticta capitalensis TaxID=121624 RepID=UPI0031311ECC